MDPSTLKLENQLFINGKFVDAKSGKKTKIINPCTGEVITEVAEAGRDDVQLAIEAARAAFDDGPWGKLTAY